MPLLSTSKPFANTKVAIWQATEPASFFKSELKLTDSEKEFLKDLHLARQKEWLSTRFLCYDLLQTPQRVSILKDTNGKPYLENHELQMSLSHSKGLAAIMISEKACGIDIQVIAHKIEMIQHKFLNDEELNQLPETNKIITLNILWSIKEAIYKVLGKKKILLKSNIQVLPIHKVEKEAFVEAFIVFENKKTAFDVFYEYHHDYVIAYAQLKNKNHTPC